MIKIKEGAILYIRLIYKITTKELKTIREYIKINFKK